jgi:hypothetical protein
MNKPLTLNTIEALDIRQALTEHAEMLIVRIKIFTSSANELPNSVAYTEDDLNRACALIVRVNELLEMV